MSDLVHLPSCPLCGTIVGHKGHQCRVRSERPNWAAPAPEDRPVTDPDAVSEWCAEIREVLDAHRPSRTPAPAATEAVYESRPFRAL